MEQTILICGGMGFIGQHLNTKLLELGYKTHIVDDLSSNTSYKLNTQFTKADISDFIIPKGTDFVFNLACPASPKHYQYNPLKTLNTCYNGTLNLLRSRIPLLHASTSEVYGDPTQHPQTEDYNGNVSTTGPRACYDEGKRIAETLCHHYGAKIVRIFNTYGPNMNPNDGRVVPNLITQAINNQPLTINAGTQTRSLCYIDDMVDALILAMKYDYEGPINLGNPEEVTIDELADLVITLSQSNSTKQYYPIPLHDPLKRKPDISKAKAILNWQPKVSLKEGLTHTIQWFKDHNT